MTIAEAAAGIQGSAISSLELTNGCLERIAKLNPSLNAMITVVAARAQAQAAQLDQELAAGKYRGALHGIPIVHKDLVWTKGIRTTSGSRLFADFVPDSSAVVAERLTMAGAVLVGKAGLHELAYGITSDNPHFGAIRNPYDPERTPGGSSGGSGVAVATGMALMATGTDTGGSIRIPASFCGVVGLKPTYGLVDRTGIQPLGFSLDHVGPLTLTVEDARIALDAMVPGAPLLPPPSHLSDVRAGLPQNFYFDDVAPEVRDAVHAMAKTAERLGARVVEVRVPDIDALNAAGRVILLVEASALYEPYWDRRSDFGSDVLALLDQGRMIPATDYVNAQRLRKALLADFQNLFGSIDCLFTPTTPIVAPRIGEQEVEMGGKVLNTRVAVTRFVRGMNVLGFPVLSLPCGFSSSGLPIGLQMIARPFEENLLFMLGSALEAASTTKPRVLPR